LNSPTRYGRYGYRRITALLKLGRLEGKLQDELKESGEGKGSRYPRGNQNEGGSPLNDGSCVRLKISITRITCGAREAMVARTADDRGFRMLTIIDDVHQGVPGHFG